MTASSADLIVTNAVVHTLDSDTPAEAFAVAGGKVVAVGPADSIKAHAGAGTRTLDLGGATVIPGLMDVHNHHGIAGQHKLFELQFPDTYTVPDICSAVKEYIADHPEREWVVGSMWGSGLIAELAKPEALVALDAVSAGKKVVLVDDSHHNRFANTAAMRAGGIGPDAPNPAGGKIVRDDKGRPTGLLLEAAGMMVAKAVLAEDPPTPERSAACSADGIATMHSMGITAFLDAGATRSTLEGLKHLDDNGKLKIWASSCMLINDQIFGADKLADDLFEYRTATQSPHHRPDFAKIFLDGVPMSYTSAFLEPYLPSETHGCCHKGHTTMPVEELEHWLLHCAKLGINVKIHCTGDASVRFVLDSVAKVREAGYKDTIFHVAHGQFVHRDDIPRFGELNVVADISPPLWFPGLIADVIGAVRPPGEMKRFHPNRNLADVGAIVSGGSDWPVSPDPNPWIGIAGLVTRMDPLGEYEGVLAADQALNVREAVAAYTINTARALGIDSFAGTITPGKSADFVVLDRDPFTVSVNELAKTKVNQTWFAGECVFGA